jgi:hypothetical protein
MRIATPSLEEVLPRFKALFQHYGVPKAIQCDNGSPFIAMNSRGGLLLFASMRRSLVLSLVVLPLVLVGACGGDDTEAGSSGSSGSSGLSDASCTTGQTPGGRACVPGTAAANASIEVVAETACLRCFTTLDGCQVEVKGSTIALALRYTFCPPGRPQACEASCGLAMAKCSIPKLPAGKYVVEVAGEGERRGLPPRELLVSEDGTESSCTLRLPFGSPFEEIDGSKYARSCGRDADCVVASVGRVCEACACPNAAISTAGAKQYESDFRALSSQCPQQSGSVACAACAPVKATCDTSRTCKLVPAP